MKKIFSLFLVLASVSTISASLSAQAASVSDCEGLDSIGMLIGNTKTFGKGGVKVAYVSTEEPAIAPDHILVFVYGEEMSMTCSAVSFESPKRGFGSIDFDKTTSSYNSKTGLTLTIPVQAPTIDAVTAKTENLIIHIDRHDSLSPVITTN